MKRRTRKFNPNKRTDIEIKLAALLKEMDIVAEEQKHIKLCRCTPDFYIPSTNTCLFADGDYWHKRKRQAFCDKRINRRLEKAGYNVLRFWGSDILKNIEKVATILREKIIK